MNSALYAGQVLDSGFEIAETAELAELKASGIWAKHRRTGLEVFHILHDDTENLFAFAFPTIRGDSTGAAHILEHSVLCGSERYPLQDAFAALAQGSLQTFLNAWTFPDKTVYPASSTNERDYFNLMAVYGDAVFHPILSEWTFMQEGHRLEFVPSENGGERLSITGVVYNEMKGEYSSMDAYTDRWSVKGVLLDTPYAFESGGDPDHIPDLTWEDLRRFHRERYSPGNCRVFLAGNIPTEKQLAFIAEKFLSDPAFSESVPGGKAPAVPRAKPLEKPQCITVPCPAGGEQKPTAILSWLCGDALNSAETVGFSALTEVLLGHDGSPLTRVLIESGLGEDLAPSTGFESSLRETVFTAGLRGVQGTEKAVEDLILQELRRLVKEGIPRKEIEAALFSMEFSHREIRRSGGPWSLVWLQRSLRGWLHGAKPWDRLLFVPVFTELKKRLAEEPRFFENLIETRLLNNPHRSLILIQPDAEFLAKKEAALAETLARTAASMSAEAKQRIREKNAELARIQTAGDAPETLKLIPHLSRKDLDPAIETVPREYADAGGIPVLTHNLFANGIVYLDFAFPLDGLAPEDYLWLPLFSKTVVSLGLPGLDYGETAGLLARTFGGFYGRLETSSAVPGASRAVPFPSGIFDVTGRDWFIFRMKTLDERLADGLDLALRMIGEADFSDHRRIRDLVLEMKNDIDAGFAPSGHHYAGTRAGMYSSRSKAVEELWHGIRQIEFMHKTAGLSSAEIAGTLVRIRDALLGKAGLIVNVIGSGETVSAAVRGIGPRFGRFGGLRSRNPGASAAEPFYALLGNAPGRAVFGSPSLQVGFAGMRLESAVFGTPEQSAEAVFAHQLSTGALWEDIRMKGGAYGAFAFPDSLERAFSLCTYRDPNPLRSLESFASILRAQRKMGEDALEKAIIGAYAKESHPRTPAEHGGADFLRFLYGIEDTHRARKRRNLLCLSADDLLRTAERLAAGADCASAVILAGMGTAEKAADKLGLPVTELPL
ncbi:MAG: insulinase family protein [Spirochaetaceae bacterium]|jgi:Zn-dependent M16 (insulinase) family peptidase|nr:insulinase family protein [Spirochaetaceae bacterium]